jgi:hypothetical protein
VEEWERNEKILGDAVTRRGRTFELAPGEGAFYGPKLEFHVTDAIGRSWQLGTIQLDSNLPHRFDLSYVGSDNAPHRPVMLHRAVLGSIERFLSVYIEHTAGWFPVWLAPEQVVLVTVADRHLDFANALADKLRAAGLRPKVDPSSEKLTAKIRTASLLRPPYIGEGRGGWEITQDGATTVATFTWEGVVHRAVMRAFAGVFTRDQAWAFARGEESVALELARRRARTDEARARVDDPPAPTTRSPLPFTLGLSGLIGVVAGAAVLLARRPKS